MNRLWLSIALCGVLCSFTLRAQNTCVTARKIIDKINTVHIKPRSLNDSLSADIFSEFFRALDGGGRYLTAKDTGKLVRYRTKLDEGNEPVCSFITASASMLKKKVEWYKVFTDSILKNPLDLTKNEFGPTVSTTSFDIAKNNTDLKERIVKELKEKVLLGIYRYGLIDSTIFKNPAGLAKAEAVARQKTRKKEFAKIDKLLKDDSKFKSFVETSYLKAIPTVFDPHSSFFSKEDLAEFTEMLNPSALSFGIKLTESATGDVTIASVVPGGPAWDSNQINKDDALIGIQWKASREYVDYSDLDKEDIEADLSRQDEVSGEVTIRKTTGETRKVKLVKEKIDNEENIVSGFVLKSGDSKRSIGYINLPGFFTDFNSQEQGCAVAVTRELIKLKGESIEGLILDLRFNGGGSLQEAIELSGLFIDAGPVAVVQKQGNAPAVLKDMNRGTVYDGPMVVMVNGASASASEVFSAAMQDHNRAVIAGSTTYGKATGQIIIPLDDNKPLEGFLKVTDITVNRINGKSHQLTGVTPDFPIRDLSSVAYRREEQYSNALKPVTTNKKVYYTPLSKSYKETVKYTLDNSPKTTGFKNLDDLEAMYGVNIPLEQKAFMAFMKTIEAASKKFTQGFTGTGEFSSVTNSEYDITVLKVDPYRNEMNKQVLEQVRSSIYIQEAYRLLDNIITGKQ